MYTYTYICMYIMNFFKTNFRTKTRIGMGKIKIKPKQSNLAGSEYLEYATLVQTDL